MASTGGKRQLGASGVEGWLCSLWVTGLWSVGCSGPASLPVGMLSSQFPQKGVCAVDESKWHPVLRMCLRKRTGSISSFRELEEFSLLERLERFTAQGQDFKVVHYRCHKCLVL